MSAAMAVRSASRVLPRVSTASLPQHLSFRSPLKSQQADHTNSPSFTEPSNPFDTLANTLSPPTCEVCGSTSICDLCHEFGSGSVTQVLLSDIPTLTVIEKSPSPELAVGSECKKCGDILGSCSECNIFGVTINTWNPSN